MLPREALPRFDIPGFEINMKPDSNAVNKKNSEKYLQDTVAGLIHELSQERFALETRILEEGSFKIRISKLPSVEIPTYQLDIAEGVFRWIYDALYVVLSNNQVFSGLGKSTALLNIPTLELPDWNSMDIAIANLEGEVHFDIPRMDLHNFLYNLAVSFILRHEIRHIANGHVGHLLELNGNSFNEDTFNGLSSLDSQTLEMDVDSCVFAGFLEGFIIDAKYKTKMPIELQNDRGILMSSLFTIQFLFYCLPSRKVTNLQQAAQSSHPNAFMRYFYCYTAGVSLLEEKHQELLEGFTELGSVDFQFFLNQLFELNLVKKEPILADQQWTLSSEGMNYAHQIWDNWNKWIPRLKPLAYLKLAGS